MNPDGPTRPTIPPGKYGAFEDGTLGQSSLSTPYIDPANPADSADVAGVNMPPILPYLTPDAMLVYCQSRLTGINTQCRDIMTKQETNAKAQSALGDLLAKLDLCQGGVDVDPTKLPIFQKAYQQAIDDVGGPTSPLGEKLAKDRDTMFGSGDKNAMSALLTAAKSHQAELNSDSEIGMIHLQSLMSQRQTAIQLTTNIVQSLNDQANKIVANIGH
jgi:hypothetical protein